MWREQGIHCDFYDVNSHVWLGLFELSFVLCKPHLPFPPGLRGEVSCSH